MVILACLAWILRVGKSEKSGRGVGQDRFGLVGGRESRRAEKTIMECSL